MGWLFLNVSSCVIFNYYMLVGFFFCIFVFILIVYDVYLLIFCIIIILCLNVNRFEGSDNK